MSSHKIIKNLLLSNLSRASFEKLSDDLEYIKMPHGKILAEPGELIEYVYFPDAGMVSTIAVAPEGQLVEVGTVGREGFSGINVALGVDKCDRKRLAQMDGYGWKITRQAFKVALSKSEELSLLTRRFALTLLHQTAQSALCNRLHTIEERCARWLLLAQDRNHGDTIDLTQDFMAMMLGVRRAGVNVTLRVLQNAGILKLTRGVITVNDRKGIEEASCGCYKDVNDFYFETMGFSCKRKKSDCRVLEIVTPLGDQACAPREPAREP